MTIYRDKNIRIISYHGITKTSAAGLLLVAVLAQNEPYHGRPDAQRFRFCCLMLDGRVRKRFLNDLYARFWRKRAPTLDLEKNCLYLFLHEYVKLGR
jgi:hypothetical protein